MNLQSDSAKMLFLCKLVVTPKTINITEASKCCINFCQWPEFDFLMWVLTIDKTVQSSYPSVCVPSCSLLLVWTGSRPESCTKMQQPIIFFPLCPTHQVAEAVHSGQRNTLLLSLEQKSRCQPVRKVLLLVGQHTEMTQSNMTQSSSYTFPW